MSNPHISTNHTTLFKYSQYQHPAILIPITIILFITIHSMLDRVIDREQTSGLDIDTVYVYVYQQNII